MDLKCLQALINCNDNDDLYLTIKTKTAKYFTYCINQVSDDLINVKALSGRNNTSDYAYVGFITKCGFNSATRFAGTRLGKAADVFKDLWNVSPAEYPRGFKVYKATVCSVCGKLLTKPNSIECCVGEKCAHKLQLIPGHAEYTPRRGVGPQRSFNEAYKDVN